MIAILLLTQTAWYPPAATGFDYNPGRNDFARPVAIFDKPAEVTTLPPVYLQPAQVYLPGFT